MKLNKLFAPARLFLCCALAAAGVSASADCLTDVDKYRIDKDLYNECIREANTTDNAELQYLVALWHLAGIREVDFETQPNKNGYRHFIYLASQNGSLDAMSMYVITEYDRENHENNAKDLNMVKYLNALSEDKSPEGVLRMLTTKIAINMFREGVELPELEKLAADPKNLKAKFELAKYYQSVASPSTNNPKAIDKAWAFYKPVIEAKTDDKDILRLQGISLWNMYNYYRGSDRADVVMKSEPFIRQLAYRGDVIAMVAYAMSFDSSVYGVVDDAKAYAWISLERECVKGTILESEYSAPALYRKISDEISDKDRESGEKQLAALKKEVTCLIKPRPKRPPELVKKAPERPAKRPDPLIPEGQNEIIIPLGTPGPAEK